MELFETEVLSHKSLILLGRGAGTILPMGSICRARLGPDYTSRANFLTLLNFRRKFSLKRVRN